MARSPAAAGRLSRRRRRLRSAPAYLGRPSAHWVTLLGSADPLLRRLAAYALGEIGPGAGRAGAGALRRALADEAMFVRVWAAAALARVDPLDRRSLPLLVEGMVAPIPFVRSLSVWHLGRVGAQLPGVASAVARMSALLEDPDANVRAEAALCLRALQARGVRERG